MTSNELKTIISKLEHIAANTENALCTICEDPSDTLTRAPIIADSITGVNIDIAIGAAPAEQYNMSDLAIADVADPDETDSWWLEGICVRSKARKRGQPRKQLWTVIACGPDCVVLRSEPKTAKSKLVSISYALLRSNYETPVGGMLAKARPTVELGKLK
jgi:hypothetical protein